MAAKQDESTPESISRQFLSALAEGRWEEAADLISPESAERLRAQLLYVTRQVAYPPLPHDATDTAFRSPLQLLHLQDADALQSLPVRELLVRWMRALHPAGGEPDDPKLGVPLRIENVFLDCRELTPSLVETRYRAEWYSGGGRRMAGHDSEQTLTLAHTQGGWRIVDVDLAGSGHGHLVVPDDEWEGFKYMVSPT